MFTSANDCCALGIVIVSFWSRGSSSKIEVSQFSLELAPFGRGWNYDSNATQMESNGATKPKICSIKPWSTQDPGQRTKGKKWTSKLVKVDIIMKISLRAFWWCSFHVNWSSFAPTTTSQSSKIRLIFDRTNADVSMLTCQSAWYRQWNGPISG